VILALLSGVPGSYRGTPALGTGDLKMSTRNRLGRIGAVAAAAIAIGVGGAGMASAATAPAGAAALAAPAVSPNTGAVHGCVLETDNGHYVTAVGDGGRTTDVIHTDATQIGAWEKFTLVRADAGLLDDHYGILTGSGHYLTAVGGGGRTTDVIHSDATQLQSWEDFTLVPLGDGVYNIKTYNGHYLTAVDGGGLVTDAIHSDATRASSWELFFISCGH
jgi:hypothetical protein